MREWRMSIRRNCQQWSDCKHQTNPPMCCSWSDTQLLYWRCPVSRVSKLTVTLYVVTLWCKLQWVRTHQLV